MDNGYGKIKTQIHYLLFLVLIERNRLNIKKNIIFIQRRRMLFLKYISTVTNRL